MTDEATETAAETTPDPIQTAIDAAYGKDAPATEATTETTTQDGVNKDEATKADAKATVPESTHADDAPTLSDRDLSVARRFKVDQDTLLKLPDAERARVLETLRAAQSDIGKRYAEIGKAQRSLTSKPAKESDAEQDDAGEDPFDPVMLGEAAAKHLKAMQERIEQLEAQLASKGRESVIGAFDKFVNALDKDAYSALAGGKTEDLVDGDPVLEARTAVLEKAAEIQAGYMAVHRQPMAHEDAFEQALTLLYPNAKSVASQEKRAKSRESQLTQRTQAKHTVPVDPMKKVYDALDKVPGAAAFFGR